MCALILLWLAFFVTAALSALWRTLAGDVAVYGAMVDSLFAMAKLSVELMLLAVNINLVAFSVFQGNVVGQVFAMLVLTVAAAEAAIGLAIVVVFFRNRGSIAVEDLNLMKG